ncbi:DUF7427 family protein [Streptomyces gobiensis]|uniref:DUF7427 family protein n=1 Tax=Streptomyces gobiensis TaxID=2875706 RepID=UPI001E5DECEB|nr:hypothetical protein [Streptomyces gobiensis]UGY92285.1 hypothetical protein test1122_11445 [Streptomyces gobiensis]
MTPDLIWGVLLLAGVGYEVFAIFNTKAGDTLSERVRAWFRTHTHPGRAVFAAVWVVFAGWFLVHILG